MQINLKCYHCGKDLFYSYGCREEDKTVNICVIRCKCKDKIFRVNDHLIKEHDFKLLKNIVEKIESKFKTDE